MHAGAGGQLDDVSVRVAEIDRPDKAMIDRAAHLFSFRLRFSQHRFEDVVVDGERDVQVERILPLEFERLAGGLKKRQARAVRHLEKRVQGAPLVDLERAEQRQAEKFLVEHPRLRSRGSDTRCGAGLESWSCKPPVSRCSEENTHVLGRQYVLVEHQLAAGDLPGAVDAPQYILAGADKEVLFGFGAAAVDDE